MESMKMSHSMAINPAKHTLALIQTHKKNSNAWLSKRELRDLKKLKMLYGDILAILNKITPQNFKDLSVQILKLGIDNMDKLEIAVEIIFEKAVLEPLYSKTYANLCKIMGAIKFPEEQNAKVSPFRKTLLNRCQKEFFREKSDEDKLNKKMDELQARTDLAENEKQAQMEELLFQRSKLKKKILGNINFIGELFNLGMLSSKIILSQCIGNLLAKRAQGKLDDEVVECIAKLFSTVGLKLENECVDELKKRAFGRSFGVFKELGSNSNYAYRIRFMIQDVVELRDNNWVPRRIVARPQRIDDIHREHVKEEQEEQQKMEAAVASSSRESKSRADLPDERGQESRDGRMDIDITVTLRNFFEDPNSSKNDVFSYIDVDPKAIGMYEISEDNFSKVMPILKKYLQSGKSNPDLELHALDAAQLLIHEMKHPRDLAYVLFGKLEDDEIITENGFRHWRENGKEQQGHGSMRQNLKSFFLELQYMQDSDDGY